MTAIRAASANAAHVLDKHQFLMPRAVVVHDGEHGQLVMHSSPQNAWRVIEIAIGLNVDDDAAAALCRECRSNRGRRSVTHAAGALSAEIAIRFVVIP